MKILFENKQLNEGPGAGYTVSGTLTNVKVNAIKDIKKVGQDGDTIEYEVEIDATSDFDDVSANSYYYGGTIDSTPVNIDTVRVEFDDGDITESDIKWAIEGVKVAANLGGGWSHSTFDGKIDVDYMSLENAPYLTAISFELTNSDTVGYLDRAVQDDMDESLKETEPTSKSLTEDFDEDERIQALAEYLDIDPSEISNIYDYEFETPEGDYLVVDEYEAEELAKEDIRNLYDDLGLESFTPDFRDWIIMNALDNEWFEDAIKESYEYYVEDIEEEASSMGYENRLIEEMHDHQVLSDDDFEEGEDGEPDLTTLKDDVDIDYLKENFVDLLVENAGNPVDYCGDNFGWDWVAEMASQNNLIDLEEVVEQCIYEDGIAHFISRYDGKEHELGNGLYAYRTN